MHKVKSAALIPVVELMKKAAPTTSLHPSVRVLPYAHSLGGSRLKHRAQIYKLLLKKAQPTAMTSPIRGNETETNTGRTMPRILILIFLPLS